MKSKVTILCATYNHEKYIKRALDSFLMQKTDFPFEVIIGEDCSTDKTVEIVKEYAEKYPDIIKPFFNPKNYGNEQMFFSLTSRVNTEYVALCDGDDYWTNPHKLQKQVDFLDANKDFSICFHRTRIVWEDNSHVVRIYPNPDQRLYKNVLDLNDFLKTNPMCSSSIMYRWRFNDDEKIEDHVPRGIHPQDWYLNILHAEKGKAWYIPEIMSIYWKNSGGIFYGAYQSAKFFQKWGLSHMKVYELLESRFGADMQKQIASLAMHTLMSAVKLEDYDLAYKVLDNYTQHFDTTKYHCKYKYSYYLFKKYLYKIMYYFSFGKSRKWLSARSKRYHVRAHKCKKNLDCRKVVASLRLRRK